MRETRTSGSTSGKWNRNNAAPLLDSTNRTSGSDCVPVPKRFARLSTASRGERGSDVKATLLKKDGQLQQAINQIA